MCRKMSDASFSWVIFILALIVLAILFSLPRSSTNDPCVNKVQSHPTGTATDLGPPRTVKNVDLKRYMGKWYEVAKYPVPFEPPSCVGATAEYSLNRDGTVNVVNTCLSGGCDGKAFDVRGIAKPTGVPARFKVTFDAPVGVVGDYWIIDLDEQDYQWAVVSDPRRQTLWILSRNTSIDQETYQQILKRLKGQGYDTSRLVSTTQCPY